MEINISKYCSYFHDGSLIAIEYNGDNMVFALESAEMHSEDFKEDLWLSKHSTMKGKLYIVSPNKVLSNNKSLVGQLEMKFDYASIYDLEVIDNTMRLFINWEKGGAYTSEVLPSEEFLIEGKQIYWEPVRDLVDPYW